MRDAVRAAVRGFTDRFESTVPWMYLDVRGLVTVAIGNLIDPLPLAIGLPFLHGDGSPATREEIAAEWGRVKSFQSRASAGGGWFREVTTLHLAADGIARVFQSRLNLNEVYLRRRFAGYDAWPADAQLGVISMAWAEGPAFDFPRFEAAALKQDFSTCSLECHMADATNPGLRPRNLATAVLFANAAAVLASGDDPEVLHYPTQLPPVVPPPPSTRPER